MQGKPLSISEMLAEQLAATEKLLSLNRMISGSLTQKGGIGSAPPDATSIKPGTVSSCLTNQSGTGASPVQSTGRRTSFKVEEVSDEESEQAPTLDWGDLTQPLLSSVPPKVNLPQLRSSTQGASPLTGTSSLLRKSTSSGIKGLPNSVSLRDHLGTAVQRQRAEMLERSFLQRIAEHPWMEAISLVVIGMNVTWITLEMDPGETWRESTCALINLVFCLYFVAEIALRAIGLRSLKAAWQNKWFMYDLIIVVFSVYEDMVEEIASQMHDAVEIPSLSGNVSVLRLVRVLRLARLANVFKLLHAFPELMIMASGLLEVARSIFATLCFLLLVIYVFAVLMTQLLVDLDKEVDHFHSIPEAMHILLMQVVCGLDSGLVDKLQAAGFLYYLLILLFHFIASVALMNTLIGIICDCISKVADSGKDTLVEAEITRKIGSVAAHLGLHQHGRVWKDDFELMMDDAAIKSAMKDQGVDLTAFMEFASCLFEHEPEMPLSLEEFVKYVMQFRGTKAATVRDLVELRKFITLLLHNATCDTPRQESPFPSKS